MTDDHDATTWRYETARFRLLLQPGTYFALVSTDAPRDFNGIDDGGGVLFRLEGPEDYTSGVTKVATLDREAGVVEIADRYLAFRVVGCVKTPHSSGRTDHGRACNLRSLT